MKMRAVQHPVIKVLINPSTPNISSEESSYNEWFLEEVQKGIAAADRGELISFENIKKYWEKRFESPIYRSCND